MPTTTYENCTPCCGGDTQTVSCDATIGDLSVPNDLEVEFFDGTGGAATLNGMIFPLTWDATATFGQLAGAATEFANGAWKYERTPSQKWPFLNGSMPNDETYYELAYGCRTNSSGVELGFTAFWGLFIDTNNNQIACIGGASSGVCVNAFIINNTMVSGSGATLEITMTGINVRDAFCNLEGTISAIIRAA